MKSLLSAAAAHSASTVPKLMTTTAAPSMRVNFSFRITAARMTFHAIVTEKRGEG